MKGQKVTFISICVVAVLFLFVAPLVLAEEPELVITRGPDWDKICSETSCTRTIYIGQINVLDENNTYKPFNEVVKMKWENNAFNISWYDGYIILEPFVVYNNNNFTIQQIKDFFPNVNIRDYITTYKTRYKWALNLTNIDTFINNTNYIGLRLTESSGITWDDVVKDVSNHRLIIKNKVFIEYSDLTENNFTLSIPEKSVLLIGNLSDIYYSNDGILNLDPTTTYNYTNTTHKAYESHTGGADPGGDINYPPQWSDCWDGSKQAESSDYTAIKHSDNSRWITEAGFIPGNIEAWHRFNFTITEEIESITSIYIHWEGQCDDCDSGEDLVVYFANFSDQSWEQVGDIVGTSDVARGQTFTTDFEDLINISDNIDQLVLLAFAESLDNSEGVQTDYVYVNVTWEVTANSCTYGGSGDWNIDCTEECEIDTNTNIGTNKMHFYGDGTVLVNADIDTKYVDVTVCKVAIVDGKRLG